jgi:hypothetical protein
MDNETLGANCIFFDETHTAYIEMLQGLSTNY